MEEKTKQEGKSDWKDLVQGFVVKMLEHVGDDLAKRAHVWIKQLKRKSVGWILLASGIVFVLIALSIFINALTQNLFPWVGYSIVGVVALAVGYALTKE